MNPLDHFRDYMRDALENNISLELDYYMKNYAPQAFNENDLRNGIVREELEDMCRYIRVLFDDDD